MRACASLRARHLPRDHASVSESAACVRAAFDEDPIMVPIGSTTALAAEATDCAYSDSCTAADGESGDTDFAFGNIKALCTIGEYDETTGYM